MLVRSSALVFLLANTLPPAVEAFDAHHTLGNALQRAHKYATKRTSGLAKDLRVGLGSLLVQNQEFVATDQNGLYCVTTDDPLALGPGGVGVGSGPSASTASGAHTTGSPSSTSSSPSTSATSSTGWNLVESHQGSNFFDGWDFWDFTNPSQGGDPTDGNVNYVNAQTAQANNLTYFTSSGAAVMRVETTPVVSGNRMSVRITTNNAYTEGLWIMDSTHIPTGCATWPAFWTDGPNPWPAGGEIDIVEGVHEASINQMTLHTNPGCQLPSSSSSVLGMSGSLVGPQDCASADTGNAGCGVQTSGSNTFGPGFNSNGGGVYAMMWTADAISVYFWPRSSIPSDVANGAPNPSSWGTPQANWPNTDCNLSQFFGPQNAIFDITLCGQWAGGVWSDGVNQGGQTGSCQSITGDASCSDFVAKNGASFAEAYWEVNYVKIYQFSS